MEVESHKELVEKLGPFWIHKFFSEIMTKNRRTYEFFRVLSDYEPAIFGGFCRDAITGKSGNDLDIILMKPMAPRKFGIPYTRNKFCGYRLQLPNVSVDLWHIARTKWIQERQLEPTVENLFKYTNRDENRLLYYINEHKLVDGRDVSTF